MILLLWMIYFAITCYMELLFFFFLRVHEQFCSHLGCDKRIFLSILTHHGDGKELGEV